MRVSEKTMAAQEKILDECIVTDLLYPMVDWLFGGASVRKYAALTGLSNTTAFRRIRDSFADVRETQERMINALANVQSYQLIRNIYLYEFGRNNVTNVADFCRLYELNYNTVRPRMTAKMIKDSYQLEYFYGYHKSPKANKSLIIKVTRTFLDRHSGGGRWLFKPTAKDIRASKIEKTKKKQCRERWGRLSEEQKEFLFKHRLLSTV